MHTLRSIIAFARQALIVACFGISGMGTAAQADDSPPPPSSAMAALAPVPRLPSAPQSSGGLRVTRLVLARPARAGQPVIEAMSFSSGTRVCAIIELANPGGEATTVTVSWQRPSGNVQGNGRALRLAAQTTVSAQAFFVPRRAGTWTVIVRSADGEELMRQEFDVSARSRRTRIAERAR